MKKVIDLITIIATILFSLWFINEPSYEPAIGFILSAGTLLSTFFIDHKKRINKFIYVINIRGLNNKSII